MPAKKIRNPNIEIRNKRKELNPNYEIRNGPVWNIGDFVLVIRICFGFRVSSFFSAIPWRPLRPFDVAQDMLGASHRISDLIFMNQKFQIYLVRCKRSNRSRGRGVATHESTCRSASPSN